MKEFNPDDYPGLTKDEAIDAHLSKSIAQTKIIATWGLALGVGALIAKMFGL